ncbi:hypothetical protein ACFWJT_15975 [Streptomyces sp. NPDC127069]|uniref:hypothetical protein n=1 Tax=Streptomyces sp. NPDC127069 TaxID=3347128 RepID=UPI00364FE08F
MLADPPTAVGLRLLTTVAPLHCWAWIWVFAGVAAAASAFVTVGRDFVGFAAALIPPAMWAISYAVAAVSGDYSRGGFVAVWYLTSVGVTLWAAALPEYSVPKVLPRRSRE